MRVCVGVITTWDIGTKNNTDDEHLSDMATTPGNTWLPPLADPHSSPRLQAGEALVVFDRDATAVKSAEALGAKGASSTAEVRSERIFNEGFTELCNDSNSRRSFLVPSIYKLNV